MEYISGVVERITFENEDNGFSVIKIKSKGYADLVTVVGSLAAVNVGAIIRLKGEWKMDSKFGKQFAAQDYRETLPATVEAILKAFQLLGARVLLAAPTGRAAKRMSETTQHIGSTQIIQFFKVAFRYSRSKTP